jgi:hypothetical protein
MSRRRIVGLYATYLASMTVLVWWLVEPPRIEHLTYLFGAYVRRMLEMGSLAPSAKRSPLLPLFLMAVASLKGGTLIAATLKNLLLQPLQLWSLHRVAMRARPSAAGVLVIAYALSFPQLMVNGYRVVPEEGWLIPILAFLFYRLLYPPATDRRAQWLVVALLIGLLPLIKSSMRALVPILVVLYALRARDTRVTIALAGFCIAGFLAWGAFNHAATGEFRLTSSNDGPNLLKGNNPRALELYPDHNLDPLTPYTKGLVTARTEWAHHDESIGLVIQFWRDHPQAAYKLFVLRAYRFFLATGPVDLAFKSPLLMTFHIVGVLHFIVFRVVFLICIGYALVSLASRLRHSWRGAPDANWPTEPLLFLTFTMAFCAPYLIGFTYERHVLPLVVPTLIFSLWLLDHERERLARTLTRVFAEPADL